MATTAPGGGADRSVADELRRLGVKGVLVQMAERGQLLAVKCEMPQCYHHKGRGEFDQVTTPRTKWAPSPDHYPILKSAGGHLRPENVRLAHIYCNKRDYEWRKQIRTLLAKGKSLAEIAEVLNRKGVLVQMAERGQLLDLKCEMPQCYHHKGRAAFDPVAKTRTKWAPSPDHYPILKSAGGQLVPENVRLSHTWCNNRDYGWRTQIRTLLSKGKSLAEIAETLNRKEVPPAHGTNRWTAAMVRKAYVS